MRATSGNGIIAQGDAGRHRRRAVLGICSLSLFIVSLDTLTYGIIEGPTAGWSASGRTAVRAA